MAEVCIRHFLTIDDVLALRDFPIICGPQFAISPCGSKLAFAVPGSLSEASRFFLTAIGGGEGELHIVDMETGHDRVVDIGGELGVLSPVWSPDGATIAIAVTDGSFIRPAVVDVDSGALNVLLERNLTLPGTRSAFMWSDDRTLSFELTCDNQRTLWLDIEKRGATASIASWKTAWEGKQATASALTTSQPKTDLEPTELCSINMKTGQYRIFHHEEALSEHERAFVERVGMDFPPVCVGVGAAVPRESQCVAFDQTQSIYLRRGERSTEVLRLKEDHVSVLHETDTHLQDVAPSRIEHLPFLTRQGREETLRLVLPPDHVPGEKRAAVLWVYPGLSVTDNTLYNQDLLNDPGLFNLHLLAARGFVVIVPGIPITEDAHAGRELADCLLDAVVPACEATIDAGYVDPENIHVFGHSLGGWSVLMLLAETDIFRSGIAMAGTSNLLARSDDVRMRYGAICEDVDDAMMMDNFLLSGPPWQMLDRYVRNSPLFSVERFSAPVLMMHGDQDYVEIGQSEQMFAALRSLGKKAELVRYWGEGHVFESPANIRDAWSRIFAWLEA